MSRTLKLLAVPAIAGAFILTGVATAQADQTQHHDKTTASASHKHADGRVRAKGHNHQAPPHKPYQSHPVRPPHVPCTIAPKCRPAPLPKPAGGWPCAKDHSCSTKHHVPICKPPVKPPVTPVPKPPAITPPKHTVVHHVPAEPVTPAAALPRTGPSTELAPYVEGGCALILAGFLPFLSSPLRRFTAAAKARIR